jgi:hypothetical protein
MWEKQDLMGKKLLAKTLYPSGITVDRENILYRTENQNVFIEYIQDITGNFVKTKKRNSELKLNYSAWVGGKTGVVKGTPFNKDLDLSYQAAKKKGDISRVGIAEFKMTQLLIIPKYELTVTGE